MTRRRALLVLAAGVGIILGCSRLFSTPRVKFSGTLELTEHAVGPRLAGRLEMLLVDEGQAVTQGQLLGTLDRYEQATRDYDRAVGLLHEGGATQQQVEQAALAVEDQRIVSPIDGIVLVKVHEAGEVVAAGGPVVVIGDPRKQWVRIYVPEGVVNRVHVDQPAQLRFDGVKQPLRGRVIFVAPTAEFTPRNVQTPEERITQTFAVKVLLDEPRPTIRPGVAVDVALDVKG